MTTLAELWNGNLSPIRDLDTKSGEIQHLETLLARNRALLEEDFTDEQAARWEILAACEEEYRSLLCEQAFCSGFRLGTKISVETLCE